MLMCWHCQHINITTYSLPLTFLFAAFAAFEVGHVLLCLLLQAPDNQVWGQAEDGCNKQVDGSLQAEYTTQRCSNVRSNNQLTIK